MARLTPADHSALQSRRHTCLMNAPATVCAVVVLILLFVSATWTVLRPSRMAAFALIGVAIVWVLVNGPLEGYVLYSFTPYNGLTVADLFSIAAVGIALWTLGTRRRR